MSNDCSYFTYFTFPARLVKKKLIPRRHFDWDVAAKGYILSSRDYI